MSAELKATKESEDKKRALRNLCAGEILNQNCFIEEDGVNVVVRGAFDSVSFDTNSGDVIIEIIRFGLELLGNVCGAGKAHQAAVWFGLFPVVFKDIARVRVKKTSDVLSMVIYSCCNGSNELMRQLCEVQGLQIVAEIVKTASRGNFCWSRRRMVVGASCKNLPRGIPFLPLFFILSTAGALEKKGNLTETDDIFTLENEFLLSILHQSLNKKRNELNVSKEFTLSVLGILKRVVAVVNFFSRGQSKLPTGTPVVDVLGYSINIYGSCHRVLRFQLKRTLLLGGYFALYGEETRLFWCSQYGLFTYYNCGKEQISVVTYG